MSQQKIDCIIPYYNEANRIIPLVNTLLGEPNLRRIICVDDGSAEKDSLKSMPKNERVLHIRHDVNRGKTAAVKTGLELVKTAWTLVLDADLINLKPDTIQTCINETINLDADLCILRQIKALPTTRLLRLDILLSGERIIRTSILRAVLRDNFYGYQLEIAINKFCQSEKLRSYWISVPFWQLTKIQKYGLFTGFINELRASWQIVSYQGISQIIKQIFTFKPAKRTVLLDNKMIKA